MSIKYYILRLRDFLFPPKTNAELFAFNGRSGKYSYLAEREQEEIRNSWKKLK
jgi:hypothetical protein